MGIVSPDESLPRNLSAIEKPTVSLQVLIFSINSGNFEILLVNRLREPFKGYWSIPGDIIAIDESLEEAAKRILCEKTGIDGVYLEQLYTFGDVNRDPRGRVITVTYFALLPHHAVDLSHIPHNLHVQWTNVRHLPELAFDHHQIIDYAINRIQTKLLYSNLAHALLPETFRYSELQKVYESILGKPVDKRNFRKKMQTLNIVEPTNHIDKSGNHRPARLYKFTSNELILFD